LGNKIIYIGAAREAEIWSPYINGNGFDVDNLVASCKLLK